MLKNPLAIALLIAAQASTVLAADKVKTLQGTQSTGKLTEITPTEVMLELGPKKTKIPVNEIDFVQFDSEPNDLTQARLAVRAGRYDDATTNLAKLDNAAAPKRTEVARDIDFYRALTAARLALAGKGSIADAGKKMLAFEKANKSSFHYFETCQTLGDLLVALGKFEMAEGFYKKLAEAPWKDYQIRAEVLVGRALVSQKKYPQAQEKFDAVLAAASEAGDDAAAKEAQRLAQPALVGKAAALSGQGKHDEAIKLAEQAIAKTDPQDTELYARAYIILGNSHKAEGKKKEALLDFLHVDLLYTRYPELHAEALANLATLWADVDKTDRAKAAKALLKEKYPNSTWAAK